MNAARPDLRGNGSAIDHHTFDTIKSGLHPSAMVRATRSAFRLLSHAFSVYYLESNMFIFDSIFIAHCRHRMFVRRAACFSARLSPALSAHYSPRPFGHPRAAPTAGMTRSPAPRGRLHPHPHPSPSLRPLPRPPPAATARSHSTPKWCRSLARAHSHASRSSTAACTCCSICTSRFRTST